MLTVCYAAKGGQGTTTITAALALRPSRSPLVVIDAGGDLPAVLGVPDPVDADGPGVARLLRAEAPATPDAVATLARRDGKGPAIVAAGGPLDGIDRRRWDRLGAALRNDDRHWLVDAGMTAAVELAMQADHRLLVTANCFVALRRARRMSAAHPTGVVLVEDPDRALREADVAAAFGWPIVAVVRRDARVATVVDAGLLAGRVPDSLRRPLVGVAGAPS